MRRRLNGGKGHLIERLARRNVWTEGVRSWWASGFAGAQFPKGVPQLPRPAIIRLNGVTISVNVPDSEPRNPSKAEGYRAARVQYRHHSRRRHREILSVTP